MNEFDQNPTKVEVHEEVDQKKGKRFIGSMTLKKGTKCYFFNLRTCEFGLLPLISQAKSDPNTGQLSIRHKAQFNDDCLYTMAINPKNAARKFNHHSALRSLGIFINLKNNKKNDNKRFDEVEGQEAPGTPTAPEGSL